MQYLQEYISRWNPEGLADDLPGFQGYRSSDSINVEDHLLQRLLDERAPGRYNVVNLGVPGSNSAEIVSRLPGWIARYRPFAVIVCVGSPGYVIMNAMWIGLPVT